MLNNLSILSNAKESDIRLYPFPHIVVKDALDSELFSELEKEFPSTETVVGSRYFQDTWYDYPACKALDDDRVSPLWKKFLTYHTSLEFYKEVISLFGEIIKQKYPFLESFYGKDLEALTTSIRYPERDNNSLNLHSEVSLECQYYLNYSREMRTVRGPHVDRPSELYAALLYFRKSDDLTKGGDLQICSARRPEQLFAGENSIKIDKLPMEISPDKVAVETTINYAPNTLVFFLNSNRSIHAVTSRSPTEIPRRHINFTADLFTLPGGLFEVDYRIGSKIKRWLENQPGLWRLEKYVRG